MNNGDIRQKIAFPDYDVSWRARDLRASPQRLPPQERVCACLSSSVTALRAAWRPVRL